MLTNAFALLSLAAATVSPEAPKHGPHVVIDERCLVTEFYRIPLSLKLSELNRLKIDHTRAYYNSEGEFYPEATLLVEKGVLVQIEFSDEDDPVLYQLMTSSPGAIGPRGVGIGTTLKEVRARWPEGKFYWATAHGNYVAFTNGTNVYFEFDPHDMPAGTFDNPPVPIQNANGDWVAPARGKVIPDELKLKVTRIRITSGDNSNTCKTSNGKK